MRHSILRALAPVLGLTLVVLGALPLAAADIDPALEQRLASAAPEELLNVYVLLDAQLDGAVVAGMRDLHGLERRARVVGELKRLARDTQAPLLAELDAARAAGRVGEVRSLWIANLLIAELDAATIRGLAADSAVRSLHLVHEYAPGEATDDLPADPAQMRESVNGIEPNISLINAPSVWEHGYRGQAKVVATIDTGVYPDHPDLANHIWTNVDETLDGKDDDGNGFVDDVIGWDFESNDNDPTTSGTSHGTQTAGIVVGDGTNGRQTGVAPEGFLMILKACAESPAMQAVQYAVDNGADAITSSCSYKFPFTPAYAVWREISKNTMLAGLAHANSIGNQGQQLGTYPIPYNISAPGITPSAWLHPDQTIIGGLGAVVATGGVNLNKTAYGPSGKGPAGWENIQINYPSQLPIPSIYWDYPWANGEKQGLLKPDVVMPTNVITTYGSGGYSSFGGTSAATPHTGGSLALLLSAAPNATPADLSEALQTYAEDLGVSGKDNQFGAGLPDLLQAAQSLWPEVTPILEPVGQAVPAGEMLHFQLTLRNNTATPQTIMVRIDFYIEGKPRTRLGPRTFVLGANQVLSRDISFETPAAASGRDLGIELVVEDGSANFIASTDVEAYLE